MFNIVTVLIVTVVEWHMVVIEDILDLPVSNVVVGDVSVGTLQKNIN